MSMSMRHLPDDKIESEAQIKWLVRTLLGIAAAAALTAIAIWMSL
jgi:hypothetical protein